MSIADERLFFHIQVDCEPVADRSPACGGPASWGVSERSICRIAEIARQRSLIAGTTFMSTPEAAKAHAELLRALAAEGFEMGIQPNIPGFRYPTYEFDLGQYPPEVQRKILREAKADWEDALQMETTNFAPCCGSMSDATPLIVYELGYRQIAVPTPGRFDPKRLDRCTIGMFPYPHHANRNSRILAGDLELYVLPNTGDPRGRGDNWSPKDLRSENPPTPETREMFKRIIREHLDQMEALQVPIKRINLGTHNTERVHFDNLEFVCDFVYEAAEAKGWEVVPISMEGVHREAHHIGAF